MRNYNIQKALRGAEISAKRISTLLFVICLILSLFAILSFASVEKKYEKLSDFEEKKIAVLTGTRGDEIILANIKDCVPTYFNDETSKIQALKSDKVEALTCDKLSAILLVMGNTDLAILKEVISHEQLGFAFQKGSSLKPKVQRVIDKMTADGTLQQIMDKWTTAGYEKQIIQKPSYKSDFDGSAGIIRLGYDPAKTPAMFIINGVPVGFDIDILTKVAYELNMRLELVDTPVSARIESLTTNRIDIASCGMTVTPEREEKVDFVVYYQNAEVLVVKKTKLTEKALSAKTDEQVDQIINLDGVNIGATEGTTSEIVAREQYPKAKMNVFKNNTDAVMALKTKKIEYVAINSIEANNFIRYDPELVRVGMAMKEEYLAFSINKQKPKQREILDKIVQGYVADGTIDEIASHWLIKAGEDYTIVKVPELNNAPVLNVAATSSKEPLMFMIDGEVNGFAVELIKRAAYDAGMRVELYDTDFAGILAAVSSGKCDVGLSTSMTEERKKTMDFTSSYLTIEQCFIGLKTDESTVVTSLKSMEDLKGKRIGYMIGSIQYDLFKPLNIDTLDFGFKDVSSAFNSLLAGKIDAVLMNNFTADSYSEQYPEYISLPPYADLASCMITNKDKEEFGKKIDAVVEKFMADGTFKRIDEKWRSDDENLWVLDEVVHTGKNGTFVAAALGADPPNTFYKDTKIVGIEIDLFNLIARELDMNVDFSILDFDGILAGIATGKLDIAAGIVYSPERAKAVRFSTVYNTAGKAVVMVKKNDLDTGSSIGFFESFKNSFSRTFIIENRYQLVFKGLWVTILISLFSLFFGTLCGSLICTMRLSRSKILDKLGAFYVRLVQGLPIVLILMVLYYIIFAKINIAAEIVAIIGFSLNFAAYSSEIFRTAILATDKGQIEAAYAGGFSKFEAFTLITLPQSLRHILPVFKGEFISMVKMTSVVGYIAIQDLTKVSDIIRSRTYEAFFPLIATAVIYFVITYVFIVILNNIEARIDPKRRERKVKIF